MKIDYVNFKRTFDVILSIFAIIILSPFFLIIALLILLFEGAPIIYWSQRVGRHSSIFLMPKFRTMKRETPAVATDLLSNPERYMTFSGPFLRKTSLDEIPQLWSILIGDMSFVGPRPALFNQNDLVNKRRLLGVDKLRPGLTGLAQVNGRDELTDEIKVQFDNQYKENISFFLDLKIIISTFVQAISGRNVAH